MADCQRCAAACEAYLCQTCTDGLARRVAELPALINQLDITRTRQDRVYRASGLWSGQDDADDPEAHLAARLRSKDGTTALRGSADPFNAYASELMWVAGNTVAAWITHLCQELRLVPPAPREALAWLSERIAYMRGDALAGQCCDELGYLHRQITRVIDRSPDRFYAGPCTTELYYPRGRCALDLYAYAGSDVITCDGYRDPERRSGCGARYTSLQRRDWLLGEVASALVPLDVLKASLSWLLPPTALPAEGTWRSWLSRGRLVSYARTGAGVKLYRGSEVLALVRDDRVRTGPKRKTG